MNKIQPLDQVSSIVGSRTATLEKVSERIVLGSMTKLHYNSGRWWTGISDAFAIALIRSA